MSVKNTQNVTEIQDKYSFSPDCSDILLSDD